MFINQMESQFNRTSKLFVGLSFSVATMVLSAGVYNLYMKYLSKILLFLPKTR